MLCRLLVLEVRGAIMRITVAAIGKIKNGPEKSLIDEYCKRLPWSVSFRELEAKKGVTGAKLQELEGELLLNAIPSGSKVIVLDERGKHYSSSRFSKVFSDWQQDGYSDVSFLIGGADGHGNDVRNRADILLSLGGMTWPHMLARAMLSEQLYRAWTITAGHPYHRQ